MNPRRVRIGILVGAGAIVTLVGCGPPPDVAGTSRKSSPANETVDPVGDTPKFDPLQPPEPPKPNSIDAKSTIIEDTPQSTVPTADQETKESDVASPSAVTQADLVESDPPSEESLVVGPEPIESDLTFVEPTEAIEADATTDAPSFRLFLPTTSGPLVVDVEIIIGNEPLAAAFGRRIQAVMEEATGSSELTWPKLFDHINADPQQFGRAMINSQQHRNLIRLFDKNRNKRPDHDEVAKFLFRMAKVSGPFRLVGSDFFREINRAQSAAFAAMDENDNRVLESDEIDRADQSLYRLDHNGDRRIDFNEVASLPADDDPAWKQRRSGRWGQVAMDLSGYIDWKMLSYNLDEAPRSGVFGQDQNVIAKLDQDGDDSIDSDEARSLLSVQADARLLVRYPLVTAGQNAEIEIASVSSELEQLVGRTSSANQISISGDSLRLIARVADLRTGRNQIPPEAFAALDANNDGGLDESEIPEPALQEYSFEDLDQDEDGKLTLREINEGMSPKAPIWNVQVRARGAESPDGVFAWLDQNQDYMLSTREVIGVVDRLRTIASPEGSVRPSDIPDSFVIQFGRGDPNQDNQLFALTPPAIDANAANANKSWPRWAQSMDTNRDGDISRQEFPGTPEQFNDLDQNEDGFIDTDELLAG